MAIVWPCSLDVKSYAAAGRDVVVPRPDCPTCSRPMTFRSGYDRVARADGDHHVWVRRAECRWCASSHALIPSFLFTGRLCTVEVIGSALLLIATGAGARSAARRVGVPHTTARAWWHRFRARAGWLRSVGLAVVVTLGMAVPGLALDVAVGALEALAAAWSELRRRLAERCPALWPTVSLLTGGSALATTTTSLYPTFAEIGWMPTTT